MQAFDDGVWAAVAERIVKQCIRVVLLESVECESSHDNLRDLIDALAACRVPHRVERHDTFAVILCSAPVKQSLGTKCVCDLENFVRAKQWRGLDGCQVLFLGKNGRASSKTHHTGRGKIQAKRPRLQDGESMHGAVAENPAVADGDEPDEAHGETEEHPAFADEPEYDSTHEVEIDEHPAVADEPEHDSTHEVEIDEHPAVADEPEDDSTREVEINEHPAVADEPEDDAADGVETEEHPAVADEPEDDATNGVETEHPAVLAPLGGHDPQLWVILQR
jgi:hypothetical protein